MFLSAIDSGFRKLSVLQEEARGQSRIPITMTEQHHKITNAKPKQSLLQVPIKMNSASHTNTQQEESTVRPSPTETLSNNSAIFDPLKQLGYQLGSKIHHKPHHAFLRH